MPIFNSNRVKLIPKGCERLPEAGACLRHGSIASSRSGLAGGLEDGWEREAGFRAAVHWRRRLERVVGWEDAASNRPEVSCNHLEGGLWGQSCQLLYPCDLLLFPSPTSAHVPWVKDLPTAQRLLSAVGVPFPHVASMLIFKELPSPFCSPPASVSATSLLLKGRLRLCILLGNWDRDLCRKQEEKKVFVARVGMGNCNSCYCEGLLPCSETGKPEDGDELLSDAEVLCPFTLSLWCNV